MLPFVRWWWFEAGNVVVMVIVDNVGVIDGGCAAVISNEVAGDGGVDGSVGVA